MDSKKNAIGRDSASTRGRGDLANQPNTTPVNSISKIRCIYTNIDSIRNKVVLFRKLIVEVKPHIIFITETKLCPDDQSSEYLSYGDFTVYRKDRETTDGGGGVAILVISMHFEIVLFLINLQIKNIFLQKSFKYRQDMTSIVKIHVFDSKNA